MPYTDMEADMKRFGKYRGAGMPMYPSNRWKDLPKGVACEIEAIAVK